MDNCVDNICGYWNNWSWMWNGEFLDMLVVEGDIWWYLEIFG